MAPSSHGEPMRIGEVLKRARTRQGMEIRTAEDRTKIRTKYLRALEAEDWEILPSPAYAKGFLRTYAQLLGLDADAVVDEFRDQVETRLDAGHRLRLGEPVLESRRRGPDRGPGGFGPATLVAIGVGLVIVALLLVGLLGGDDGSGGGTSKQNAKGGHHRGRDRRSPGAGHVAGGAGVLRLMVEDDLDVCLLSGDGDVLVEQLLAAGTEDRFRRDSFELRFPTGYERSQFGLSLDGARVRLPARARRAAFEIRPGSPPRRLEPPGEGCP